MISILGKHITLVRPSLGHQGRIFKDELPTIKYNKRPRRITESSGKVKYVCVKLVNGGVRAIRRGTHADVVESFGINLDNVAKIGWQLENDNFVWR